MKPLQHIFFSIFPYKRLEKSDFPLSFAGMALCIALLLVFCSTAAVFFLDSRQDKIMLTREHFKQGRALLQYVADQSKIPLLEDDDLGLQSLLQGIKNVSLIDSVAIRDHEGRLRAHAGKEIERQKHGSSASGSESLSMFAGNDQETVMAFADVHFSQNVSFQDTFLGTVDFILSREELENAVSAALSSKLAVFGLPGLVCLALSLAIALVLIQKEKKYRFQVVGGLRALKSGEYGHEIRPLPKSKEFNEIARAFNMLSKKLMLESVDRSGLQRLFSSGKFGKSEKSQGQAETRPHGIMRTHVTVLFASIKGFKAYAELIDPHVVLENLNEFFEIASRSIAAYGGYVDRFIGDAVISVFVPSAMQSEHRERAVMAAVSLQKALQKSQNENVFLKQVGIGISSGVVLSGKIGTRDKKENAFIGESFKVAYSLNFLANPGDILLSEDVGRSLESEMALEPLPPREIIETTDSWVNFRLKHFMNDHEHL